MIDRSASLSSFLPQIDHLTSALVQGVKRAQAQGGPVLVSVVTPFHPTTLDSLTAALDWIMEDAFFWRQPGGDLGILGIKSALNLHGSGESRFQAIQAQWGELMNSAIVQEAEAGAAGAPVGPLLLGGFGFDPLSQKDPIWQRFPDGLMILPQAMVTLTPDDSWLTLNRVVGPNSDVPSEADALYRTALRVETALQASGVGGQPYRKEYGNELAVQPKIKLDEGDSAAWKTAVEDAARIIRSGSLEKAVLARSVRAYLPREVSHERILKALMESYPECYTFAVRLGERTFIGATPERLVALRGLDVETMSLAGSTARGADPEEDFALGQALLSDPKNLWEHQVVVDSIRQGLSEFCAHLDIADRPRLLKVRNVQHLWTPVSGKLRSARSVLELVARLHPTPAVGGHPTKDALKLIREIEGIDRGWYAGPIGWMDRHSDGDFAVALRSALVGAEEAFLFAGCGIVGDSDPQAEYDESALKLKTMIHALERSLR